MAVQHFCDGFGVGQDAGDIAGGRETSDEYWPVGVAAQLPVQTLDIQVAGLVLGDDDDVGDGFPPGKLVRVVLERAKENHRPLLRRDAFAQVVRGIQIVRDPQVEDRDELVDRAGSTGPGEDDQRVVITAESIANDVPGVLAETARLPARSGALGVGVRVEREHLGRGRSPR